MIRVLFGSAVTLAGLGMAMAYTGPDLLVGPAEPPMVVSSAEHAVFMHARFEGGCAPTVLHDSRSAAEHARPTLKLVAYALQPDGSALEMAMREIPGDAGAPTTLVSVLFDGNGRPVGVHEEPAATAVGSQACEKPTGAGPV